MPSGSGGTLGVVTQQLLRAAAAINPSIDLLTFMLFVGADFVDLPLAPGWRELFHDPGHDRDGLKEGEDGRPHGNQALNESFCLPSSTRSPTRLTTSLRIEAPAKMKTPYCGGINGMTLRPAITPATLPTSERILMAFIPPVRVSTTSPTPVAANAGKPAVKRNPSATTTAPGTSTRRSRRQQPPAGWFQRQSSGWPSFQTDRIVRRDR